MQPTNNLSKYKNQSSSLWLIALTCMGVCLVIIWAGLSQLPTQLILEGRVESSDSTAVLQSQISGKLKQVEVNSGDYVKQGQTVAVISSTHDASDQDRLQRELFENLLNQSRLNLAEAGYPNRDRGDFKSILNDPRFNPMATDQSLKRVSDRYLAEKKDYQYRLLENKMAIQKINTSLVKVKAILKNLEDRIRIIEKIDSIDQSLVIQGVKPGYQQRKDKLNRQSIYESYEQRKLEHDDLLHQRKALLQDKKSIQNNESLRISKERQSLELEQVRLEAQLKQINAKVSDYTIKAPVSGKVSHLSLNYPGDRIEVGQVIAKITPQDKDYQILTQIPVTLIHKVMKNHRVVLQMTSIDESHFRPIEATIVDIAAYPNDDDDEPGYEIILKPMSNQFESNESSIALQPGMPIQVLLQTGQQSLLFSVFKPLLQGANLGFRES